MTRERAIELLKGFQFCCDFDDCTNAWDCEECVDALNMAIEALQTDIVRCKDCKWYENACTFFAADPFERAPMEKNDFCSYGERRIENLTVKLSKEQPRQDGN